jgi:hypothetical protein
MITLKSFKATLTVCSAKQTKNSLKVFLIIVKAIGVFLNRLENDFFRYQIFILKGRSAFSSKSLFF